MAKQKFDLSLCVRMDVNHNYICSCSATLYSEIGRVPALTLDLHIDEDTNAILKKVCKNFRNLAMNNIYFIDVYLHSLTMKYHCDGISSPLVFYGDLISNKYSGCSLALLLRILGKSDYVV